MKILSWNVNGLRAVYRRGFLKWLGDSGAEIVCLQEIKAQKEQLPKALLNPPGYFSYFNSGKRKGHSGIVLYTKRRPVSIKRSLGLERFDREGRMLQLDFKEFLLINLYLPHGGRMKENLEYKLDCYQRLISLLKGLKNRRVVLIGDFNIAHKEIDLARPKENRSNIMFTPEEREQIDKIIQIGFLDSFRKLNREKDHYTWWPYAFNARERNLGWRIDYAFVSAKLRRNLKTAFILKDIRGSDHCPISLDLD